MSMSISTLHLLSRHLLPLSLLSFSPFPPSVFLSVCLDSLCTLYLVLLVPSLRVFLEALPSSMVLTLEAKFKEQKVSSTLNSTGDTHTIMSVLESWDKQSCSRYVRVELRNGTCDCEEDKMNIES